MSTARPSLDQPAADRPAMDEPSPDRPSIDQVMRLDVQLCFAVHAASRAFDGVYRVILRETGLTYPQYLVLLVLWEHGPLSIKTLGEKLRLDSGTLSPLVKRLEAAGYVERRRSAADERSVFVHLTEAGAALRAKACELPPQIAASTGMSLAEVGELRTRLVALTEALGDAAERAELAQQAARETPSVVGA